ncbi:MAG: toll-Interleukin receptor [Saprospiraceae bacterium]|nr:toll-Interleukin receptor [Saprospiraceae bacterium]
MTLLSIDNLRSLASEYLQLATRARPGQYPTYEKLITENNVNLDTALRNKELSSFDIFLSHAIKDAPIVAGIMIELILMGYTVYVDWVIDPQADRSKVTKATAELLIKRMQQSRSLFWATTTNAEHSRWMPWELGYKHGENGKCAILPVKESKNALDNFAGQEYLGIYDVAIKNYNLLWICPNSNSFSSSYGCTIVPPKIRTSS